MPLSIQKRKDNAKSFLQIDEQGVQDIFSLVDECKRHSFDPEKQIPRTLKTDAYALEELVNDFESAYEDGYALVQVTVITRLISISTLLIDSFPKKKQKIFINFKLPDFSKKRSQDNMETSALVATIGLFIKTGQELAKTTFEQRIIGNLYSTLTVKNPRYYQKCIQIYCNLRYGIKERQDILQIQNNSSFFQNLLNKICLQASLKSHLVMRCKETNKRFIYHEKITLRKLCLAC